MSVKLLTEHHLEFLSLTGDCTGSCESTLVKMPHCWKSHVTAHFQAFSEKITWGEKTDWVGKKLTSQIFPLGKKLTGQFFPQGKNGPAHSFPREKTDWGKN